MVLPGTGKPFEVFQADDVACRQWANYQIGNSSTKDGAVSGAAAGTVLGGGVGAALGAAGGEVEAGAAMGAGSVSWSERLRGPVSIKVS